MAQRGRATGRQAGRTPARTAAPAPARTSPADLAARRARLRAVIEPVVAGAGYDLEDLTVTRAGRRHLVRVIVDGDGGVEPGRRRRGLPGDLARRWTRPRRPAAS